MSPGYYQLAVILALCVTLPLYTRVGASIGVADLIAFPAGACLAIDALRSHVIRRRLIELYRVNRFVYWYVAWAALAAIAGTLRSTDGLKACKDLIPGIVLYSLVGLTVDTPLRLRGIVKATLGGAICHMTFGIAQGVLGGPYLAVTSGLDSKLDLDGNLVMNSPVGLFSHPNALGFFLLPITLFLVTWLWSTRARPNLLLAVMLALVVWILQMSQVKGIYAFVAVGLAIAFWPRSLERWRFIVALCLPVVAIIGIMWFTTKQFLEGEDVYGTLIGRLELWDRAVTVVTTDRFTQLFGNAYALFDQATIVGFDYPNAHNAWLNQILSFGVAGMVLYLACFASTIRILCRRVVSLDGSARAMALAAIGSLAALAGESFFEPTDRGHFPGQVLLVLAAAIIPAAATGSGKREMA